MKSFASFIPAMGLIAAAQAWSNETAWTTVTVQTLTTYCPEATTIVTGGQTYTATASETLTITDCPCTVTHPVKPTFTPGPVKPTHTPHAPHGNHTYPIPGNSTLPPVWVTTTVSEFTTYCPAPTVFPVGPNSTITVTEPTTLTVTACPCTLTKPGVVTTTISLTTTYCPVPTTITIGTSEYPVTAPGTVTIPVEHVTTVPVEEPTAPATVPVTEPTTAPPAETTPAGSVGTVIVPTSSPSAPLEANSAVKRDTGFGAVFAAGIAAMLL